MHGTNFGYGGPHRNRPKPRQRAKTAVLNGHFVYNDAFVAQEDENEYCKSKLILMRSFGSFCSFFLRKEIVCGILIAHSYLVLVDAPCDWDKVCCVVLDSSSRCPICLDDPVACWVVPSCGHVYCGGCKVQLQRRSAEKCVVCQADFLHLRPARFGGNESVFPQVGASVRMNLMVRRRDLSVVMSFAEFCRRAELGVSFARLPVATQEESAKCTRYIVRKKKKEIRYKLCVFFHEIIFLFWLCCLFFFHSLHYLVCLDNLVLFLYLMVVGFELIFFVYFSNLFLRLEGKNQLF
jgi:hypothetical protein